LSHKICSFSSFISKTNIQFNSLVRQKKYPKKPKLHDAKHKGYVQKELAIYGSQALDVVKEINQRQAFKSDFLIE